MKVSVIVAVYNSEKYLRECLDSIIGQALHDIEIICVNDGSTDDSLSVLNEYAAKDSRITIISKENEGLGGASARNLGLEMARGEYIGILDSDDFFEFDMLEKMVSRAEETVADIVVCGGFEYDSRNGHRTRVPSILNEKVIPEEAVFSYKDCPKDIFQLSQGMAWNKLYRREFLEKHDIRFQSIKYTDDAYFTFSYMVLAEKIAVINEPFIYYRIMSGSSQSDGLADYPESAYLPYVKLKESLINWGIYEEVKQSFVNCVTSFMRYFYDRIDDFEAFEYLHNQCRNEIFQTLDISGQSRNYFYDDRVYLWQKQVSENTAGQIAFLAARSYGYGNTTASLRFEIPYRRISLNSRIVIFGSGIMGRHYYSQLLLSAYCDVVLWCDVENPNPKINLFDKTEIKNVNFDFVLIAYAQQRLIKKSVYYLNSIGVPNEKIILGGTE